MRKSFTRLFGFLLLNVIMLFSVGLYAQTQSTVELKAPTVTQCYNLDNSYSADVQVQDFIAMKSFDLTLKYDKTVFGVTSVTPVADLGGTFTYSPDPVTGKLNVRWTNTTAITYADNAFAKLFTVNFYLLNPSATATSYASTLVWDSASYFYYDSNWAAGTTYQTNTTALTNGSVSVPVSITADAIQASVTAASCYGSNALITVTSPVGSGYMYYFNGSTGSASPTAAAFAPSTNTVVVVDGNKCASQPKTVTVAAPAQLSFTAVAKDAICNGGNGSITFSPVGSTAPYTYWVVPSSDWSYFQNKLFYSNLGKNDPDLAKYVKTVPQVLLPVGVYYINVNSATDCNSLLTWFSNTANPAWQVVGIGQPAAVSVATSWVDATCTTKGSITASVSGGTSTDGSYLVSIDNVNWKQVTTTTPTVTFDKLVGGTYTVTAIDSKGCIGTSVVTIDTPDPIVFTLGYTDASCFNGTTGTISITSVSGGGVEASYEYTVQLQSLGATPLAGATWSSTSVTTTGLTANYYSVFVRDNYGCTATYMNSTLSGNIVPIQNPAEFKFTTNAGAGAVACNGGSYTLTVTATGGVTPYVYSFDGGTTTKSTSSQVFTNLTANTTVSVTVTDAHGCSLAQAVVITVPATLTATISSTDPVLSPTCPGGNDGRATVIAQGGTAPYQYSTDGVNFREGNVVAVREGVTTITVRDLSGCTAVLTATAATLTPTTLTAAAEGKITCHGASTGRIQVTNTWQAGRTIQYLYASSASAVYTSGTAFNPYMINGSANTATPTTFAAGTYYIGAKDQMDCMAAVTSVTITENDALTATVATVNATCFGLYDGSITINTLGGNGQPTYAIANTLAAATNMPDANFQTLDTYSSTTTIGKKVVSASRGIYYVVLKDACGRSSVFGPYAVNGYEAITFNGTVAKTASTCAGANNGTITVPVANVHGGKPGFDNAGLYTFTLTKPSGATASNTTGAFTGLAGGQYTVTITDGSGCSSSATIAVSFTDPAPVQVTNVLVKNISCKGANNGEITVTAQGGVPTYALAINSTLDGSWLPFSSSSALSKTYVATQPGVYTLYVKDANGCLGNTVSVTVSEPAALTASVTVSSVTCMSGGTGTATITAVGGWSALAGTVTSTYVYGVGTTTNTTNVFGGLVPGAYVASVSDNTGVTTSTVSTASATITYTYPQITCKGNTNFTVNPLMPYMYTGVATAVKCKGGNDGALLVTVLQGSAATTTTAGDEYYVQLTSTTTPTLTTSDWKLTTGKKYTFNGLVHGHYTVWIASSNAVSGMVTGAGNIYTQGACVLPVGTEPMNPNQTGPYIYAESWEVQEPATALTASATWTSDIACTGGNGGSFVVNAAGGTAPYSYSAKLSVLPNHVFAPAPGSSEWQSSTAFTNKVAGTWIVWALDANGCVVGGETDTTTGLPVDQWRVQIKQPLPLTFTATKNSDVTCFGANDGKISLTPSDATRAPFTYTITGVDYNGAAVSITGTTTSAVQTSYIVTGIPANTTSGTTATNVYTVSIMDKNQCTSTSTTVNSSVKQSQALTANVVKAAGSFVCPGDVSGVIEAQVSGGSPAYQYQLFKDGAVYTAWVNYPSFIVEVGHTWAVLVKDANGCTATGTIVINAPLPVTATMMETTCYSDATASVIVKATGEPGRTFLVQYKANTAGSYTAWQPFTDQIALSGFIFANSQVTQNFYYFNVKDNLGCTTSFTYSFVPTQHPLQVTTPVVTDLTASMTITGGISPYTYSVGTSTVTLATNGDTFQVVNLPAGQNTITVYDAHGCSAVVAATVAPITVTASPATGNAMKNSFDVTLTFNRDVTGVASATTVAGGTISSVTGTGKVYTVTVVGADLATVTLTVGNTVKDAAGSTLSPSAVFTYGVGDNTAPKLVSWTPNNVTLTNNHPTFVLTFDENIAVGSGNIKVYKKSGDALALTVPVTGAAVSGKTATVTYVYDSTKGGLDKNTDYYVLLDAGAFKDVAGNASGAVATSTAWTFKTGDFATVVVDPNASVFKVYPNPFVDYVTVTNASELSKVVVSNIAGQVVKEVVYPDGTIQLNELRSGVYFITLYQDNEVVSTVKLLKR